MRWNFFLISLQICSGMVQGQIRFEKMFGEYNHFSDVSTFEEEYDFIIVGAGTAGSLLANRLTEVSDWQVLLLEAGKEENPLTDLPLLAALMPFTDFNWGYHTEREVGVCEGLKGKRCPWPRGKVVGGTSVINFMMFTRGNKMDFDGWAELGNEGWAYKDVLPFFKKFENVQISEYRNSSLRGSSGELNIRFPAYQTKIFPSILEAVQEHGIKKRDINGAEQLGVSRVEATLTRDGLRMSSAKTFLNPIKLRPNLYVAKKATVTSIIIDPDTKMAVGVSFIKDKISYNVSARLEVILSAGTMNSPQLLMLSGIGPRNHLEELGIPVIQDLPVGDNLQDHAIFFGLNFFINSSVGLVDYKMTDNLAFALQYLLSGTGPFTLPGGVEGFSFINTRENNANDSELPEDMPDIELIFPAVTISGEMLQTSRRFFGISDEVYNYVYRPSLGKNAFGICVVLLHPKSRGRIRLRSTNPLQWPLMYASYYRHQSDLKTMARGIRQAIKIALESESLKKYKPELLSKPFRECDKHIFNTDKYWMCAAKLLSCNLHHQVGTCKMGPLHDKTAVVDPRLRVKGIRRLRVVDASIMPMIVSGHTMSTTYMIAEKAAHMIKEDNNRL